MPISWIGLFANGRWWMHCTAGRVRVACCGFSREGLTIFPNCIPDLWRGAGSGITSWNAGYAHRCRVWTCQVHSGPLTTWCCALIPSAARVGLGVSALHWHRFVRGWTSVPCAVPQALRPPHWACEHARGFSLGACYAFCIIFCFSTKRSNAFAEVGVACHPDNFRKLFR